MYLNCFQGAALAAGSASPFDFPEVVPSPGGAGAVGSQVTDAAQTFLESRTNRTMQTSGRLLGALSVVDTAITMGKLAIAYDGCVP
jgi:hypothetical protein